MRIWTMAVDWIIRLASVLKAHLAVGTVVVADEDDETELGASIGIVKPNSLSCFGERPFLGNFTYCDTTRETVNVS